MNIKEPKDGCEILCEADSNFGASRELRVYSIRRPKFRTEWRIMGEGAFISDVQDWDGVLIFLKNIKATDIEVIEY